MCHPKASGSAELKTTKIIHGVIIIIIIIKAINIVVGNILQFGTMVGFPQFHSKKVKM